MAAASLGGRRPSGAVCGEDTEVKWSREKTCTLEHMLKNMDRNTAGDGSLLYIYTKTYAGQQTLTMGHTAFMEDLLYEMGLKGKIGFHLVANIICQLCLSCFFTVIWTTIRFI